MGKRLPFGYNPKLAARAARLKRLTEQGLLLAQTKTQQRAYLASEVHRAHAAVQKAIKQGILTRPLRCQQCNKPGRQFKDGRASIQAHHHNGYDRPLDVMWLCIHCHFQHDPRANGERQGSARLTEAQVREIRSIYQTAKSGPPAKPYSLPALAKQFNVSHVTIDHVVKRKIWKHVE